MTQADAACGKNIAVQIHAISGATISSTCVTRGVKQLVKNFAYRIALLDRAIQELPGFRPLRFHAPATAQRP